MLWYNIIVILNVLNMYVKDLYMKDATHNFFIKDSSIYTYKII